MTADVNDFKYGDTVQYVGDDYMEDDPVYGTVVGTGTVDEEYPLEGQRILVHWYFPAEQVYPRDLRNVTRPGSECGTLDT